jgi:hypothetical protein
MECVQSIAKFLGQDYSKEQIESLLAFTSFGSMKKNNAEYCKLLIDINVFEKDMEFFRKGQIGDWRNHFSEELSKRVDDYLKDSLKSTITFDYGVLY